MPMIHPLADVQTEEIGKDTRIWQFSVVLKGAKIGGNCNICAHTFIEGDVVLGNNVTVKSGVYLLDGTRVEDDVFIGPNATFTNDRLPRSKQYPEKFFTITLKQGCSVGSNATLLPGITIGRYALVGAGAVVTKDVPDYAIVAGNPAKVLRYLEK